MCPPFRSFPYVLSGFVALYAYTILSRPRFFLLCGVWVPTLYRWDTPLFISGSSLDHLPLCSPCCILGLGGILHYKSFRPSCSFMAWTFLSLFLSVVRCLRPLVLVESMSVLLYGFFRSLSQCVRILCCFPRLG